MVKQQTKFILKGNFYNPAPSLSSLSLSLPFLSLFLIETRGNTKGGLGNTKESLWGPSEIDLGSPREYCGRPREYKGEPRET